jgi:hypothetical protein
MPEESKRDPIAYYTDQYSQAVQALEAIRLQSETFRAMGSTDDLRQFLDQFIEMASRTAADAHMESLERFAAWFLDLVQRAEQMKALLERK